MPIKFLVIKFSLKINTPNKLVEITIPTLVKGNIKEDLSIK